MHQCGRLQPMESQFRARVLDDLRDGAVREPTTQPRDVDPVAEIGAPERTTDDVVDVHPSADLTVVGRDHEADAATCGRIVDALLRVLLLRGDGEERLRA